MKTIFKFEHVTKSFNSTSDGWEQFRTILFDRKESRNKTVLNEVSIQVQEQEVIGVIGHNGSGKSTLLKLAAGLLAPDSGIIKRPESCNAIIELGLGFDMQLTGVENIKLTAGFYNVDETEIEQCIAYVYDFTELGNALEQPIKTYSSGMLAKLSFAIATFTSPQLLIVDEVLSVGDIYFQQKSFGRIKELISTGTSVLFVSHDLNAVSQLCNKVLVLHEGSVVAYGDSDDSISTYQDIQYKKLALLKNESEKTVEKTKDEAECEPSVNIIEPLQLESIDIDNLTKNNSGNIFVVRDICLIRLKVKAMVNITDPHVGIIIKDRMGTHVFETNTYCQGVKIGSVQELSTFNLDIKFPVLLQQGEYSISLGYADSGYDKDKFESYFGLVHNKGTMHVHKRFDNYLSAGLVDLTPTFEVNNEYNR